MEGIATACQCEPDTFQPNCCMHDTCPNTQRLVRLHFALGVDHNMARLMYFANGDKVCPNMYAISVDEWEHNSNDESDLSLPLF